MKKHNEDSIKDVGECLSKKELSGYTDGSLNQDSYSRVASHLESCEMCSMAVKGFATAPEMAMLGVLENDLNEMVNRRFPAFKGWNFQQVLNVVLGVVVVGGAAYFFNHDNEIARVSDKLVTEVVMDEGQAEFIPKKAAQENMPEPVYTTTPKKKVKPEGVANEAKPQVNRPRDAALVSYMPLRQMDASALNSFNDEKEYRAKIAINTKYVYDMKTYDYEKFYQREHEYTWYNPNLGVPAQYAHSTDVITYKNGPDYKTIWRTYESILNTALSEYKRGKYNKALTSLNLLLDDYPSDINGLFYKGLCLYNTKKYEKSLRYMASVATDVNPTFDQEAEWFVALAHLKLGEQETAIKDLKAIIRNDGFYGEEALKKLREIE